MLVPLLAGFCAGPEEVQHAACDRRRSVTPNLELYAARRKLKGRVAVNSLGFTRGGCFNRNRLSVYCGRLKCSPRRMYRMTSA
jgi:hypothetical protein